ncbi:MAG: Wzz/FepE/Etk N-terminal domain-containing protein [Acidobacteriota bacterium]
MIDEKPVPWRELMETVFRRRQTILRTTLLGTFLAALVAIVTPREYLTRARILLTAQALSGPRQAAMSERQVEAEISLLTSRSLRRSVLEDQIREGHRREPIKKPFRRLNRAISRLTKDLFSSEAEADTATDGPREIRLSGRLLQGQLAATAVKDTNVIQVAYLGNDPEWSATFVNDLLSHHVERIAELNENAAAGTFFHQQRNLLAERWQEAREALSAFQMEEGASQLAGDGEYLRKVLSEFEASYASTETERLELQAMVEFLREEIEYLPENITANSRVTENEDARFLESRILQLELERSELLSRYKPTSVRIRALDQQIAEAQRLLATKQEDTLKEYSLILNPARRALELQLVETETKLRGTMARVQALLSQIEEYRNKLQLLEGLGTELERLQDDVKNAKEAYQVYSQKEEEARFSSQLDESGIVNVSILEPAEVAKQPQPSKTKFYLVLGTVAGCAFGFLFAFLKDWLDPSIKGAAQAYRLSGIPIIAEIPAR